MEITLSNLNKFSEQEIFNKVANHLLTQNKKSFKQGGIHREFCMYRNPDGLKCAVGCLISDSEYSINMDESSINTMFSETNNEFKKFHIKSELFDFLRGLQEIHDKNEPEYWKDRLINFAKYRGLEFTA